MISDANKGIAANGIEYNHLDMPTKITVSNAGSNNGVVEYVYTADGIKLQKRKTQGGVTTTTDYNKKYVYENGSLKQISHKEGYIEPKGNGWQYVYRYKDIWRNTRLTYADDNNDGNIDASSEIRREQNYYPFGLEHKGYNNITSGVKNNLKTYQGQEFTEDLGLNVSEWKYRISDPAIGRFWQIDPLAEDYMYNSTYAFQENKLGSGVELEGLENARFDVAQRWENAKAMSDVNGKSVSENYETARTLENKGRDEVLDMAIDEIPVVGEARSLAQGDYLGAVMGVVPFGKQAKRLGGFISSLFKKSDNVVNAATKNRVKLRKKTKETIKENAPKTENGDFIDPNTGQVIPKEGPYDIGHKNGQEWKNRKKMHKEKGSTRKEVIEAENDPDLYQIEDPSSNRSHKHEKKD